MVDERRTSRKELIMIKMIKTVVVLGFAALSAVGAHAMTSTATPDSATHWSGVAGSAR
jgi:hypothetical protein